MLRVRFATRNYRRFVFLIIALAFQTTCGWRPAQIISVLAAEPTAAVQSVADSATRIDQDLRFLASDELEGRGVGTEGLNSAAKLIADRFKEFGLRTDLINGQPFQTFELTTGSVETGTSMIGFSVPNEPDNQIRSFEANKEFVVGSFGGAGKFQGEVVFAGYGIDAPDVGYSDFAALELKGRVAIIMRRTPKQGSKDGPFSGPHTSGRHADLRSKITLATSNGAAAILFVNDEYSGAEAARKLADQIKEVNEQIAKAVDESPLVTPPATTTISAEFAEQLNGLIQKRRDLLKKQSEFDPDPLMSFGYGGNGEVNTVPCFHIKRQVANELLKRANQPTLSELEAQIDSDSKPRSRLLEGIQLTGEALLERVKTKVSNVIGVIDGAGPHAEETIVIGAHYDHIGRGGAESLSPGSKEIHNGADDNASGTVSLLELARYFGSANTEPARRLVFIAFTGEELGLLGSARYVKDPVFPLDRTLAMFNMDMVGRLADNKLIVFGTGTSSRWEAQLKQTAEPFGFALTFNPEGFGPSDHSSFYAQKIPVLHFFTGTHPDYHRPSDDWEKINQSGIVSITQYIAKQIELTLANPTKPDYIEIKETAKVMRSGSRPYVGTLPDFGGDQPGYSISGAAAGSPADKAGLKAGDRIIQVGALKVSNLDDFDLALRKFKGGDTAQFTLMRGQEEIRVNVVLGDPR
jgi:Peptidase family M28/PDZ domain/PA domain